MLVVKDTERTVVSTVAVTEDLRVEAEAAAPRTCALAPTGCAIAFWWRAGAAARAGATAKWTTMRADAVGTPGSMATMATKAVTGRAATDWAARAARRRPAAPAVRAVALSRLRVIRGKTVHSETAGPAEVTPLPKTGVAAPAVAAATMAVAGAAAAPAMARAITTPAAVGAAARPTPSPKPRTFASGAVIGAPQPTASSYLAGSNASPPLRRKSSTYRRRR